MSKKYLSNAFSLQMLSISDLSFVSIEPVEAKDVPGNAESFVGHTDTASVLSNVLGHEITANRGSIILEEGDELYVAQFTGGRLPEGATTLPVGVVLQFFRVSLMKGSCGGCSSETCMMCGRNWFLHTGIAHP